VLSDMLIEAEGNEMNASPEGEGVPVGLGVTIEEEFRALGALIPLLGIEISDDKNASDAVRTTLLMSIVELAERGVDSLVVLNVDTETSLADGSISTEVGVIINVFEISEVIDVTIADKFGVVEETSLYVGVTSEEVDVKTEVEFRALGMSVDIAEASECEGTTVNDEVDTVEMSVVAMGPSESVGVSSEEKFKTDEGLPLMKLEVSIFKVALMVVEMSLGSGGVAGDVEVVEEDKFTAIESLNVVGISDGIGVTTEDEFEVGEALIFIRLEVSDARLELMVVRTLLDNVEIELEFCAVEIPLGVTRLSNSVNAIIVDEFCVICVSRVGVGLPKTSVEDRS
jgi:hypothetical protein